MRRFGRYTLVKKLATGGMAEIWLARQRGLAGFNRFVVIKKILSHLSDQQTFRDMFLDEARMSAQLNHPNVVQIYDLGNESNAYFIAMEFIAGENLAAIAWRGMKRGRPFPPAFAARVIADACKALYYAHHLRGPDGRELKIVHRDISPQNILVTYEGEVKVVDFGIAKAATKSEHTKTGMLKGKFSYMSPEQCLGAPVDERSDIFALGILLYELCTGKRLFKHESELMILEMIARRAVVPPSHVSPNVSGGLEDIIMKALEKDPTTRFQTAQEMQLALEDYLRDDGSAASNADIAQYMRELFHDKIEEKRKLREIASRDDFESTFAADEESTEAVSNTNNPTKRKMVVGASPSQVRITPVMNSVAPGMPGSTAPGMLPPHMIPGYIQPGQTGQASYPPPYGAQGSFTGPYPASPSQQAVAQPDNGGWIIRVVIAGALLVIFVAVAIIIRQFMRQSEPQQVNTITDITPPPPPREPRKTGVLTLESVPQGATITLDGTIMKMGSGEAAKTPSDLTSLTYGNTYKIRLERPGYKPYEDAIVMDEARDGKTIRANLEPFPGKLRVEVAGGKATEIKVLVDEQEVGYGPRVEREVRGNSTVVIKGVHPTLTCETSRMLVPPNETRTVALACAKRSSTPGPIASSGRNERDRGNNNNPPPPPPPPRATGGCTTDPSMPHGFATIDTTPSGADIFVNGNIIGETPLAKHKLPSGCTEIEAVWKDGKRKKFRLTVEPNLVGIFKLKQDG